MINPGKKTKLIYTLPLILFPVALFSTALFTGKSLFWGTTALQFVPWRTYSFTSLLDGILPLWNTHNGMGAPLAANYQSAVFYPPSWILYLLGFLGADWVAWGFTLLVMVHLIWAGLGMSRLLNKLGYGPISQTISGLSFSLCGYLVARAGFVSMIFAGAWIPWLIAAASQFSYPGYRGKHQIKKRTVLIFIISASMQLLAGHAQITWYTWILISCWLMYGYWSREKWRGLWKAIKNLGVVSLSASALAGVQLSLTLEYLLQSQRSSEVAFDTAMTYSFWPWRFVGYIAPDFFGNPGAGNYWGYASFWEDAVYIGLLPFILALLTLPQLFRNQKRDDDASNAKNLVRFLWIFVFFSFLFSLGKNTPIFPFLYRYIPTFDMFNAPSRFMIWASFCLCVLAGIGYDRWSQPSGKGLYWLRLLTAGGFAITLGAFLAMNFLADVNVTFIKSTAIAGLFSLISGFLTLFNQKSAKGIKNDLWKVSVVIFVGFDLVFSQWNANTFIEPSFYNLQELHRENWPVEDTGIRVFLHPNTEYYLKFRRFLQFSNYNLAEDWSNMRYVLLPNLNLFEGIAMVNNFDPLITERFDNWMSLVSALPDNRREKWLKLMNVGVVVTRDRNSFNQVKFTPINDSQRFWWFTCGIFVPDAETSLIELENVMKSSETGIENFVILEGEIADLFSCEERAQVGIEVILDKPNRISLHVVSPQQGWLLLSEAYYPGWTVKVNNRKEELFVANHVFRAVHISPGVNFIEMRYSPYIFWIGLFITLTSCFIWFVLYLTHKKCAQ